MSPIPNLPDPKLYPIAQDPWPYEVLDANLKQWGFRPEGDHSREAQLDPEGFLTWVRDTPQGKFRFKIFTAKWGQGTSDPCWPAKVLTAELRRQRVYHDDPTETDGPSGFHTPLRRRRRK